MRHPLLIVALLYAFGLLIADHLSLPWPIPLAFAAVLAGCAIASSRARSWLIPPMLVLCGWVNLTIHHRVVSPWDIRSLAGDTPAEVRVRANLESTPTERLPSALTMGRKRWVAELSLHSIQFDRGAWQPAVGRVLVTTPGEVPVDLFAGETVEVSGVLGLPQTPVAEGLFNYRAYLRRQEIYYVLRPSGNAEWQWTSANRGPAWSDRFIAWAKRTTARGLPEEDLALRLIWAMALGSKDVLASDAYQPFVQSGTMHIFAISGLHIALIAGILVSLLRAAQIPRMWCGLVIIPLLWFYAAATGWQSSAVRSTVMMSVVVTGWSLKRPSDLLNSLSAAALIILLWDPHQLFQTSFQLSFCVVLSIALVLPPLRQRTDQWFRPDPLLPKTLLPRWRRWIESALRPTLSFIATSVAAWLGSWPLTALYFHMLSPVTLLANVVMVPLSSAALACTLGSLVCGAILPPAAELFNHAAWFWMSIMIRASNIAVDLPGAFWNIRGPGFADLAIYYFALVAILSGVAVKPRWRKWTLAGLVCVLGFYGVKWWENRHTTELTILPLNGASAVYCNSPGRKNDALIDCGNTNSAHFITVPFLCAQGVNRLPTVALTHGDLSRVGGVPVLQEAFRVEHIATSSVRFRSTGYRRIVQSAKERPGVHRQIDSPATVAQWRVLHPMAADNFSQADDGALVLLGEIHDMRILLLSDLGRPGQNALLERGMDLRADIVVTGLPEKGEPIGDALLDAIRPRLIIVVDSEYPATKRASRALRDRLKRRGIQVLFTRATGAVTLTVGPGRCGVRTMQGEQITVYAEKKALPLKR